MILGDVAKRSHGRMATAATKIDISFDSQATGTKWYTENIEQCWANQIPSEVQTSTTGIRSSRINYTHSEETKNILKN